MHSLRFPSVVRRGRSAAGVLRGLLLAAPLAFSLQCANLTDLFEKVQETIDETLLLGLAGGDDFQRPEILGVQPIDGAFDVPVGTPIVIAFSKPMNRSETQQAFSLTANGGASEGEFSWIGDQQLQLQVRPEMTPGKRYEIRVAAGQAEDKSGNTLARTFLSTFYTAPFGGAPVVVSSNPPKTGAIVTGWPVNQNITITFSEPMDQSATNDAVTLSGGPAVFVRTWSQDGRTLTLDLRENLESNVTYTLRVSSAAQSSGELPIADSYQVLFYTGSDLSQPDVTADAGPFGDPWPALAPAPATNTITNVSKRDRFTFSFTLPMDRSATQNAIRFTPSIAGEFNWLSASILQFQPDEFLDEGATYRLTISTDAVSTSGLPLDNRYTADFTVNNPADSVPLDLPLANITGRNVNAGAENADGTFPNPPSTTADNPIQLDDTTGDFDYVFRLQFVTAGGTAELKQFDSGNIYEAVSVEYVSGPSAPAPSIYEIEYDAIGAPQTVFVRLEGFNLGTRYRLRIAGGDSGLQDQYGNRLPEDVFFVFFPN